MVDRSVGPRKLKEMCWKVPLLLAFAASPGLTLGAGKLFSLSHPAWTPRVCAPIRLMEGGADQPPAAADPSAKVVWSTTKSGLRYVDEIEGSGDLVAAPMVLSVRCEGSLLSDGRRVEFDGRASPLTVSGQGHSPLLAGVCTCGFAVTVGRSSRQRYPCC